MALVVIMRLTVTRLANPQSLDVPIRTVQITEWSSTHPVSIPVPTAYAIIPFSIDLVL